MNLLRVNATGVSVPEPLTHGPRLHTGNMAATGRTARPVQPRAVQIDGLFPARSNSNVIARYIRWKAPSKVLRQELSPVHAPVEGLLTGNLETTNPVSLALAARIALRRALIETNSGCEVILERDTQLLNLANGREISVAELQVSARTFNCLHRASVLTLRDLLAWTPSRLLRLKHFGEACLKEVAGALGDLGYKAAAADTPFGGEPQCAAADMRGYPVACLLAVNEALPEGRLRDKLHAAGWNTLGDAALHPMQEICGLARLRRAERELLDRLFSAVSIPLPQSRPAWVSAHSDDLRRIFSPELNALAGAVNLNRKNPPKATNVLNPRSKSLPHQLEQLIPPTYDPHKRSVITALFGLDGTDPLTLEEVARLRQPPATRERIRQIASPFLDALPVEGRHLSLLRKALALLIREAPCSQVHAESQLIECGVLTSRLSLASILKLVERAGLKHSLILRSGLLMTDKFAARVESLVSRARKSCVENGVADWQKLAAPLGAYQQMARRLLPNAIWLAGSEQYFTFAQGNNRLAAQLARILRASPRITLSQAYEAIYRDRRFDDYRVPEEIFAAFCSAWSGCKVEDNEIFSLTQPAAAVETVEDVVVSVLRQLGRPVTRREIMRYTRQRDIADASVYPALKHSIVLTESNGLYSVIGDGHC